jgi:hypothetical protein
MKKCPSQRGNIFAFGAKIYLRRFDPKRMPLWVRTPFAPLREDITRSSSKSAV